jgi:tRNA modification GTPase
MAHHDTIAAVATPIGEGGLAVLRVSGSRALEIVEGCFQTPGGAPHPLESAASHTLHFGRITHQARMVDEVLVAVMRAPRTFTREDVVEISCHGGLLPARLVLEALLARGARLAEPGEFTRRAFLNGRIDLAQAEAVADIIHSRTELALQAANEQLSGKLSRRTNQARDDLMNVLAHVEAHIDFPEEDIAPDTRAGLRERIAGAMAFMESALATADEGRVLRRGARAAIVGRPNAGKSSLLNQLLGHDRAIVSNIPGTTRDTIEETANVRGLPIVFIDTAGLRETGNEIEREGVRRSRSALEGAELILQVLDASEPLAETGDGVLSPPGRGKRILVLNKSDLPARCQLPPGQEAVRVSCQTGQGIEALKDAIRDAVWGGEVNAGMLEVAINERHQEALRRAREAAAKALEAIDQDLTLELVAMELRASTQALGEVVGQTATEDLLDRIFSQFCIGK